MVYSKLATPYYFENFGAVRWNSRNGAKITHIVIHHQASTNFDSMPRVWATREASAHYGIGQTGVIRAYVGEEKRAWHANNSNSYSIGIELTNDSLAPDYHVSDKTIQALIKLIREIESRYGKLIIIGHYQAEGAATECPGKYVKSKMSYIINEAHKTGGTTGSFDISKYHTSKPKQIKIIKQDYAYKEKSLKNKKELCKVGEVFTVTDIVYSGKYPRYKLKSGLFITTRKDTVSPLSETNTSWQNKTGTFKANATINVRNEANTTSSRVVAQYTSGQSVTYDKIKYEKNGYAWISYTSYSGSRRYMAVGTTVNGKIVNAYGTLK